MATTAMKCDPAVSRCPSPPASDDTGAGGREGAIDAAALRPFSAGLGLMPTEARGNYFPEPPYLRETKTYHSQPLESTRHAGNYFVPISTRPIFIFFVAEVMSNYLTTDVR